MYTLDTAPDPTADFDTVGEATSKVFWNALDYTQAFVIQELINDPTLTRGIETIIAENKNGSLTLVVEDIVSFVGGRIKTELDKILEDTYQPNFKPFPVLRKLASIREHNLEIVHSSQAILDAYIREALMPRFRRELAKIGVGRILNGLSKEEQDALPKRSYNIEYSNGNIYFVSPNSKQLIDNITDFFDGEEEA